MLAGRLGSLRWLVLSSLGVGALGCGGSLEAVEDTALRDTEASLAGLQGNTVYGRWLGSGGRSPTHPGNRTFIVDHAGPTATVTFTLTSTVDAYLYLLDASGNVLAEDDNSAGNLGARLSVSLAPGTYKLVAATASPGQSADLTLVSDRAPLRFSQRLLVKPVSTFQWVYDDSGTGSNDDVSIWRPNLAQSPGYYSLGDVAMPNGGGGPAPSTALVVQGEGDLLARPVDYVWVWDDKGSGGTHDGSFWEPVAPAGYTCLGAVGVLGYGKPSTDLIRCVKNEYVVSANPSALWNDSGSGANNDVGLWQPLVRDHRGLPATTFVARPSHSDTGGSRYWAINKSATANPELQGLPVSAATAAAFAPRVWMHPGEAYFPSSTEFHLANVHVEGGHQVTNQALGCDSCTDPQFLDGQRPNQTPVPVYAELITRTVNGQPTSTTDVVYWMFYPYNNGKRVCIGWYSPWGCVGGYSTFGNHVGDWEHATVRFVEGRPSQVYLSQHASGQTFTYGDKGMGLLGWRPELFSAQGSHGVYADAARHIYQNLPNGDFLADDTGRGIAWDTWSALVPFDWRTPGTFTGSLSWLNRTERWGNPKSGCEVSEPIAGECILNDGPTGPMSKSASQPDFLPLD
ncbi:Vps62-related protein [Myxococcus sp. AM011]|uniref:Vps62-related protein n=1 Tax=Myxococcus sp. AM011 TaxID=2745200 RepID=UPI0015958992|nr:Vps62-related protein [Myxococcus sp. AM011]NVJ27209.1 Vps62-related protein [Myxococcus sp. AM011]